MSIRNSLTEIFGALLSNVFYLFLSTTPAKIHHRLYSVGHN